MFQWGLGNRASYHVQAKSEIKIFGEGGGQSSLHIQAKSEI